MIIKLCGASALVTGRDIPPMSPLIIIGGIELFIGQLQNLTGPLESASFFLTLNYSIFGLWM